ncbi:MAG: Hypothetical protein AJITA_00806 [Acetilactobacillus jinshanensis]
MYSVQYMRDKEFPHLKAGFIHIIIKYLNNKLYHISQIAVLAAIMVLLSSIPGIPLGPAPIVLENLGVMLAGLLLGAKRGTLAVFLFILLKVIGLSGSGGLALLVGPTCGYVYGWIFKLSKIKRSATICGPFIEGFITAENNVKIT